MKSIKEALINQSIDRNSVEAIYYKENYTDGIDRIEIDKKFKNKMVLYHEKDVPNKKFQNTFSIDFSGIYKKSDGRINNFTILTSYNNPRIVPFQGYANQLPSGCVIRIENINNPDKTLCLFDSKVFRFTDNVLLENFVMFFDGGEGTTIKKQQATLNNMYGKSSPWTVTLGGYKGFYVMENTPEKMIPPAIRKSFGNDGGKYYDYIIENITPLGIPFRAFYVPRINIMDGVTENHRDFVVIKVNKKIENLVKTNYSRYFNDCKVVDYTGRGDMYYLIFS